MRRTLTPPTKLFVEKYALQSIHPPMTLSKRQKAWRFDHAEDHPLCFPGGHTTSANRVVHWEDLQEPDSSPCEFCEYPLFWTTEDPTIKELVTKFSVHDKFFPYNFRVCVHHNNHDLENFDQGNLSACCWWCKNLLGWRPFSRNFRLDCMESFASTPPFLRPLIPAPQPWILHEVLSFPHKPWPLPPFPTPPSDPEWLDLVQKMKASIKISPNLLAFLNLNPKATPEIPNP